MPTVMLSFGLHPYDWRPHFKVFVQKIFKCPFPFFMSLPHDTIHGLYSKGLQSYERVEQSQTSLLHPPDQSLVSYLPSPWSCMRRLLLFYLIYVFIGFYPLTVFTTQTWTFTSTSWTFIHRNAHTTCFNVFILKRLLRSRKSVQKKLSEKPVKRNV